MFGLFSRNKTHIANAYPSQIKVMLTKEKMYLEEVSGGGGFKAPTVGFGGISAGGGGYDAKGSARFSYRKIAPGAVAIAFRNFLAWDGEGHYLTVWLPDGQCMAENFPVSADVSYIVCDDGTIQPTKYGKIWKDQRNRYHGGYTCGSCGSDCCGC